MSETTRRAGELLGDLVDGTDLVEIIDATGASFGEAFLDGTLSGLRSRHAPSRGIALGDAIAPGTRGPQSPSARTPQPDLVLLHTGRSGSTLLARAIEQGSCDLLMLREPPLFARVVGLEARDRPPAHALQGLAWWYQQLAAERGQRLGLKLTSTALLAVGSLRAAYPQASIVALLRDPLDVAASATAQPPPWFEAVKTSPVARARLARAHARAGAGLPSPATACAALWATGTDLLLDIESVTFVGYREVVDDLAGTVARLLALTGESATRDRVAESLGDLASVDAKDRGQTSKPPPLADDVIERVHAITAPTIERLAAAGHGAITSSFRIPGRSAGGDDL